MGDGPGPVERLAYSPAEAAEALGVSRQWLYALLASGKLRSVKLGRRRLIRPSDLAALLDDAETADRPR